ncbi:MAG TPA: hypothetical protein VK917_02705, partial [Ilumatobacter sp.]|nr:hypothetical protein [Ilumatobacter sp.]
VRDAVEVLIEADLSVADHGELAAVSKSVARLQAFVDLAKVQIARRGRELADAGDTTSAHALIDEGRCTGLDAKATNGRDQVCATLPEFEAALAAGAVTGAHLDALHQHTKNLTDNERADLTDLAESLVAGAATQPASLFDRNVKALVDKIREIHRPGSDADELDRQQRASKVKRWTERDTGMKNTLISLDPVRDASLWNVIDHHLATLRQDPANAQRPYAELQVDAVMASVNAGPSSARIPEVVVHVDHPSLCHGRHADTLCETIDGVSVPVSTVQRLCCEAIIQAVIVDPDRTVDRICAEQRTANRAQRRMLAAMYSTCAHPHCQVPFSACRIHHIVWWTRGGKTVLENLVPVCERHHHLLHEGGWTLSIDEQRHVTWTRPDGTVWLTDTGPNRPPPNQRATSDRRERPPGRPPDPPPARPPDPPPVGERPLQATLL